MAFQTFLAKKRRPGIRSCIQYTCPSHLPEAGVGVLVRSRAGVLGA